MLKGRDTRNISKNPLKVYPEVGRKKTHQPNAPLLIVQ